MSQGQEVWWYATSEDAEHYHLGGDTREQAEAAGRDNYADGDPFVVLKGRQAEWNWHCFGDVPAAFNNGNEDYGNPDGGTPAEDTGIGSGAWGLVIEPSLAEHLAAALREWVKARNGKLNRWVVDVTEWHAVAATAEWLAANPE